MQIQNSSGMTQLKRFLINTKKGFVMNASTVYTADSIYYELIDILSDIKLTQGPLAVSGTLSKHPTLRNLLLDHQKMQINILENAYAECYNSHSENKSFKKAI